MDIPPHSIMEFKKKRRHIDSHTISNVKRMPISEILKYGNMRLEIEEIDIY